MSTEYGSGTTGGVGFGNKTTADPEHTSNDEFRFDKHHVSEPYAGHGESQYGSGATAGVGHGNKTAAAGDDGGEYDNSDLRFGSHQETAPYSGHTEHGSGTTAGVGYGNKTASSGGESKGECL